MKIKILNLIFFIRQQYQLFLLCISIFILVFKRAIYHFPNYKKSHFHSGFNTVYLAFKTSDVDIRKKPLATGSNRLINYFSSLSNTFKNKPYFSIVVPVYKSNLKYLNQMIDSVEAQIYEKWSVMSKMTMKVNVNQSQF